MKKLPLVIAHRGFRGRYPENTLLAFEKAITEGGSHGIELDVQLTADGELVVIHDDEVDRTTNGTGPVEERTLAQLKKLNVGGAKYANEKIPTLEEVLALAKEMDFLVNIELKYSSHQPHERLAEHTIALVRAWGLEEQILFSTFHPLAAIYCTQEAPEIKTGFLYSEPDSRVFSFARRHGLHALHPQASVVTYNPMLVRRANQLELKINPWTVNEPAEMAMMIRRGVYAIITDHPDRLNELLAREE